MKNQHQGWITEQADRDLTNVLILHPAILFCSVHRASTACVSVLEDGYVFLNCLLYFFDWRLRWFISRTDCKAPADTFLIWDTVSGCVSRIDLTPHGLTSQTKLDYFGFSLKAQQQVRYLNGTFRLLLPNVHYSHHQGCLTRLIFTEIRGKLLKHQCSVSCTKVCTCAPCVRTCYRRQIPLQCIAIRKQRNASTVFLGYIQHVQTSCQLRPDPKWKGQMRGRKTPPKTLQGLKECPPLQPRFSFMAGSASQTTGMQSTKADMVFHKREKPRGRTSVGMRKRGNDEVL